MKVLLGTLTRPYKYAYKALQGSFWPYRALARPFKDAYKAFDTRILQGLTSHSYKTLQGSYALQGDGAASAALLFIAPAVATKHTARTAGRLPRLQLTLPHVYIALAVLAEVENEFGNLRPTLDWLRLWVFPCADLRDLRATQWTFSRVVCLCMETHTHTHLLVTSGRPAFQEF